jgi:hypothetical protein
MIEVSSLLGLITYVSHPRYENYTKRSHDGIVRKKASI